MINLANAGFRAVCAVMLLSVATITHAERKPIIGINLELSGDTTSPRLSIGADYIDAVTSAGGIPILLPAITSLKDVEHQLELCDGFVFTGGRDINPARYNQQLLESTKLLQPRREKFDFRLIDGVMKSKKPFLAVCLGCQEVNVALGGTLIQDIPTETSSTIDHHQGERRHDLVHDIEITTKSRLAKIVGTTTLGVNSVHHQSCGEPGRGVRYTARGADGIVESYEVHGHPFGIAVQWHPESVANYAGHLRLYKALVRAAGKDQKTD